MKMHTPPSTLSIFHSSSGNASPPSQAWSGGSSFESTTPAITRQKTNPMARPSGEFSPSLCVQNFEKKLPSFKPKAATCSPVSSSLTRRRTASSPA